ncbi:MAG: hypothetical protein ACE5GY_10360 [Thermodesulfobacteriota bacterium]
MADERVDIVIRAKDLYTQGLKKAEKAFTDVGYRLATTFKVGAAALTGYSVALGAMLKTTADAGDAFLKMSQRTGVSSQALSELAHAAELSGASIDNVEAGFRVLSKRMLDAQNGLTTAERTFDTLGINTQTATGHLRSADAVFMDAVRSINSLSSETEKAALAQELFGKSGTQLLPLIRSGTAGIAAMREEARRLGITFSDHDAAAAAAFNDELTRTKAALLGVRNTISLEFLPYVTSIAETINAEFIGLRESGEIDRWAKDAAGTAINTFETIALGAASMADTLNPVIRGTYKELKFIWNQYEDLPAWAKDVGVVGLMLGGKKGAIVIGASLHMIGVVKNQMRALEEIGRGTLSLTDFATSNAQELESKLRALDDKRQGGHPISLTMGGKDGSVLFDMPDMDTYVGKVQGFFQEAHDRLNRMNATGGGAGGGGPKGGDSPDIVDKVFSARMLARERLSALTDPTVTAPEDAFSKAWLGYQAQLA